jgi:cytochrome c biogenesis protein CcdA/glutaredoxin
MKKGLIFSFIVVILFSVFVSAEVNVALFYGQGCSHCSTELAFLEEMQEKYPELNIELYEIYFDQENRELFFEISKSYGVEVGGVPTLFIDDRVIEGYADYIGDQIEEEILICMEVDCGHPLEKISDDVISITAESSPLQDPDTEDLKKKITIPAVLGAAAIDAINPCAFAVLIILLTTILVSGERKKALFAGLAFMCAIYIAYFLMGLGLFSAIQAAGLSHVFYAIVAVLAILVGLFNLKDYFWYGKWFVMEVPLSWRPKMKALIKGVTSVPGAFFIGFVVSLFLLPCTSGPYIVILGLLAQTTTRNYAIFLLLLYNLIFVLPMLLITLAVYFGLTTTEKAEKWRTGKLQVLHLIAGVIMILLGMGMFIAMYFGYV